VPYQKDFIISAASV